MIVKKNNRREPFDRNKVKAGIVHACNKRNIPDELIEKVVNEIEIEVREIPNTEINAEYVGELVLEKIRDIDEVAYMRFASVYKGFDDAKAFVSEALALGNTANLESKPKPSANN
jgi:transcriptional repressor NrdR